MIVCKFGGSSLADHARVLRVAKIVRKNPGRRFVVVSAPGKRFAQDAKITDLLIRWQAGETPFSPVRGRFLEIARGLSMEQAVEDDLLRVESDARHASGVPDFSMSRGEYIMARMLAKLLGFDFVDAKDIIRFQKDGTLDSAETEFLIRKRLSGIAHAVIPGFYGADSGGNVRVFPRGGSDITGALIAAAMRADEYENWTDVSGFMSADPKIVPEAIPLAEIGYHQARTICSYGAEVLHPDSILPVEQSRIPTRVKNTFDPKKPGTRLSESALIGGVACVSGKLGRDGHAHIAVVPALQIDAIKELARANLEILNHERVRGASILTVPDSALNSAIRQIHARMFREMEKPADESAGTKRPRGFIEALPSQKCAR